MGNKFETSVIDSTQLSIVIHTTIKYLFIRFIFFIYHIKLQSHMPLNKFKVFKTIQV